MSDVEEPGGFAVSFDLEMTPEAHERLWAIFDQAPPVAVPVTVTRNVPLMWGDLGTPANRSWSVTFPSWEAAARYARAQAKFERRHRRRFSSRLPGTGRVPASAVFKVGSNKTLDGYVRQDIDGELWRYPSGCLVRLGPVDMLRWRRRAGHWNIHRARDRRTARALARVERRARRRLARERKWAAKYIQRELVRRLAPYVGSKVSEVESVARREALAAFDDLWRRMPPIDYEVRVDERGLLHVDVLRSGHKL